MISTPPTYTALSTSPPSDYSSSDSPMHFRSSPPPPPSYPLFISLLLGPYVVLALLTPSSISLLTFLPLFLFLSALHAFSLPRVIDHVFGPHQLDDVERLGKLFTAGNVLLGGVLVSGWSIVGGRMTRMRVGGVIACSIVGGLLSLAAILGWNITMGVKLGNLKKQKSSLLQQQQSRAGERADL